MSEARGCCPTGLPSIPQWRRRWSQDARVLAPDAGPQRLAAEADRLLAGWTQPHRVYHTLQHLAELCSALEELSAAGEITGEAATVGRVAGWYHDLAYDPRAAPGSNEHRSAALARDHLHRLGVADTVVATVERLVLMTAEHDAQPPAGSDELLDAFHDADLWILAAPTARYHGYARAVRQEYTHVADEPFTTGRSRILSAFLDRDQVYRTASARDRWTEKARINLRRELATLTPRAAR